MSKVNKDKEKRPRLYQAKPHFTLVRQEGLEPSAYWFVASRSIQLVYWRRYVETIGGSSRIRTDDE